MTIVLRAQSGRVAVTQAPQFDGTLNLLPIDADDVGAYSVATDFSNSPTNYTLTSGAWPTGFSMDSAGLITWDGTQVEGTTTGLEITATNTEGAGTTGAFQIVVGPIPALTDSIIAFSDLISGPASGLGDGLGDGTIVTVWGYNLGASQGASSVGYRDSSGTYRDAAYVYYWKNADGQLPGGPANLFESHGMQEVAFSIPAGSANGAGTIEITVGAETSTLPFTVRAGNIYHIASTGNDGSGDGSFANPWATFDSVLNNESLPGGSTVYSRGSIDSSGSSTAVYYSGTDADSTIDAQLGLVAYPNTAPQISGVRGFWITRLFGVVFSKLTVRASNTVDNGGQTGSVIGSGSTFCILSTDKGRVVGNNLSDLPGGCASKSQGAIFSGSNARQAGQGADEARVFGNEIHNYGCDGTSQQHHTTYFSLRESPLDPTVEAWEIGWNYLHYNKANLGIHNWDKDENNDPANTCGNVNGTIRIHDNVIIEQGGAGISTGTSCRWGCDFEYYNNVLIDTGLGHSWDGSDPATVQGASPRGFAFVDGNLASGTTHYVFNNLIWGWNRDGMVARNDAALYHEENENIVFTNNICVDKYGMGYYKSPGGSSGVSGTKNVWFSSGGSSDSAPSFDTAPITTDPLLTRVGAQVTIGAGSPVIDDGAATTPVEILRDIYGALRALTIDVGPVERP